jgi:predicted dinucleotide-binding enzyme
VLASRYAAPIQDGEPLDAFVAGDDDQAKATVSGVVESLGFRPVDAGALRMARSLEDLAFLNISLNATRGWTWQRAFRLVGPQASA